MEPAAAAAFLVDVQARLSSSHTEIRLRALASLATKLNAGVLDFSSIGAAAVPLLRAALPVLPAALTEPGDGWCEAAQHIVVILRDVQRDSPALLGGGTSLQDSLWSLWRQLQVSRGGRTVDDTNLLGTVNAQLSCMLVPGPGGEHKPPTAGPDTHEHEGVSSAVSAPPLLPEGAPFAGVLSSVLHQLQADARLMCAHNARTTRGCAITGTAPISCDGDADLLLLERRLHSFLESGGFCGGRSCSVCFPSDASTAAAVEEALHDESDDIAAQLVAGVSYALGDLPLHSFLRNSNFVALCVALFSNAAASVLQPHCAVATGFTATRGVCLRARARQLASLQQIAPCVSMLVQMLRRYDVASLSSTDYSSSGGIIGLHALQFASLVARVAGLSLYHLCVASAQESMSTTLPNIPFSECDGRQDARRFTLSAAAGYMSYMWRVAVDTLTIFASDNLDAQVRLDPGEVHSSIALCRHEVQRVVDNAADVIVAIFRVFGAGGAPVEMHQRSLLATPLLLLPCVRAWPPGMPQAIAAVAALITRIEERGVGFRKAATIQVEIDVDAAAGAGVGVVSVEFSVASPRVPSPLFSHAAISIVSQVQLQRANKASSSGLVLVPSILMSSVGALALFPRQDNNMFGSVARSCLRITCNPLASVIDAASFLAEQSNVLTASFKLLLGVLKRPVSSSPGETLPLSPVSLPPLAVLQGLFFSHMFPKGVLYSMVRKYVGVWWHEASGGCETGATAPPSSALLSHLFLHHDANVRVSAFESCVAQALKELGHPTLPTSQAQQRLSVEKTIYLTAASGLWECLIRTGLCDEEVAVRRASVGVCTALLPRLARAVAACLCYHTSISSSGDWLHGSDHEPAIVSAAPMPPESVYWLKDKVGECCTKTALHEHLWAIASVLLAIRAANRSGGDESPLVAADDASTLFQTACAASELYRALVYCLPPVSPQGSQLDVADSAGSFWHITHIRGCFHADPVVRMASTRALRLLTSNEFTRQSTTESNAPDDLAATVLAQISTFCRSGSTRFDVPWSVSHVHGVPTPVKEARLPATLSWAPAASLTAVPDTPFKPPAFSTCNPARIDSLSTSALFSDVPLHYVDYSRVSPPEEPLDFSAVDALVSTIRNPEATTHLRCVAAMQLASTFAAACHRRSAAARNPRFSERLCATTRLVIQLLSLHERVSDEVRLAASQSLRTSSHSDPEITVLHDRVQSNLCFELRSVSKALVVLLHTLVSSDYSCRRVVRDDPAVWALLWNLLEQVSVEACDEPDAGPGFDLRVCLLRILARCAFESISENEALENDTFGFHALPSLLQAEHRIEEGSSSKITSRVVLCAISVWNAHSLLRHSVVCSDLGLCAVAPALAVQKQLARFHSLPVLDVGPSEAVRGYSVASPLLLLTHPSNRVGEIVAASTLNVKVLDNYWLSPSYLDSVSKTPYFGQQDVVAGLHRIRQQFECVMDPTEAGSLLDSLLPILVALGANQVACESAAADLAAMVPTLCSACSVVSFDSPTCSMALNCLAGALLAAESLCSCIHRGAAEIHQPISADSRCLLADVLCQAVLPTALSWCEASRASDVSCLAQMNSVILALLRAVAALAGPCHERGNAVHTCEHEQTQGCGACSSGRCRAAAGLLLDGDALRLSLVILRSGDFFASPRKNALGSEPEMHLAAVCAAESLLAHVDVLSTLVRDDKGTGEFLLANVIHQCAPAFMLILRHKLRAELTCGGLCDESSVVPCYAIMESAITQPFRPHHRQTLLVCVRTLLHLSQACQSLAVCDMWHLFCNAVLDTTSCRCQIGRTRALLTDTAVFGPLLSTIGDAELLSAVLLLTASFIRAPPRCACRPHQAEEKCLMLTAGASAESSKIAILGFVELLVALGFGPQGTAVVCSFLPSTELPSTPVGDASVGGINSTFPDKDNWKIEARRATVSGFKDKIMRSLSEVLQHGALSPSSCALSAAEYTSLTSVLPASGFCGGHSALLCILALVPVLSEISDGCANLGDASIPTSFSWLTTQHCRRLIFHSRHLAGDVIVTLKQAPLVAILESTLQAAVSIHGNSRTPSRALLSLQSCCSILLESCKSICLSRTCIADDDHGESVLWRAINCFARCLLSWFARVKADVYLDAPVAEERNRISVLDMLFLAARDTLDAQSTLLVAKRIGRDASMEHVDLLAETILTYVQSARISSIFALRAACVALKAVLQRFLAADGKHESHKYLMTDSLGLLHLVFSHNSSRGMLPASLQHSMYDILTLVCQVACPDAVDVVVSGDGFACRPETGRSFWHDVASGIEALSKASGSFNAVRNFDNEVSECGSRSVPSGFNAARIMEQWMPSNTSVHAFAIASVGVQESDAPDSASNQSSQNVPEPQSLRLHLPLARRLHGQLIAEKDAVSLSRSQISSIGEAASTHTYHSGRTNEVQLPVQRHIPRALLVQRHIPRARLATLNNSIGSHGNGPTARLPQQLQLDVTAPDATDCGYCDRGSSIPSFEGLTMPKCLQLSSLLAAQRSAGYWTLPFSEAGSPEAGSPVISSTGSRDLVSVCLDAGLHEASALRSSAAGALRSLALVVSDAGSSVSLTPSCASRLLKGACVNLMSRCQDAVGWCCSTAAALPGASRSASIITALKDVASLAVVVGSLARVGSGASHFFDVRHGDDDSTSFKQSHFSSVWLPLSECAVLLARLTGSHCAEHAAIQTGCRHALGAVLGAEQQAAACPSLVAGLVPARPSGATRRASPEAARLGPGLHQTPPLPGAALQLLVNVFAQCAMAALPGAESHSHPLGRDSLSPRSMVQHHHQDESAWAAAAEVVAAASSGELSCLRQSASRSGGNDGSDGDPLERGQSERSDGDPLEQLRPCRVLHWVASTLRSACACSPGVRAAVAASHALSPLVLAMLPVWTNVRAPTADVAGAQASLALLVVLGAACSISGDGDGTALAAVSHIPQVFDLPVVALQATLPAIAAGNSAASAASPGAGAVVPLRAAIPPPGASPAKPALKSRDSSLPFAAALAVAVATASLQLLASLALRRSNDVWWVSHPLVLESTLAGLRCRVPAVHEAAEALVARLVRGSARARAVLSKSNFKGAAGDDQASRTLSLLLEAARRGDVTGTGSLAERCGLPVGLH